METDIRILDGTTKTGCVTATAQVKQNLSAYYVCCAKRGRGENNEQQLEPQPSKGKRNTLTSVQKDNLVAQLKQINNRVDDVSFNDEGIRPFRNNAKKSGIQELGTIGMENTKSSCVTSVHSPKVLIPEATSKGPVLNRRQKNNHKHGNEKANSFLSTSWKGSQANGMTIVGNTRIRRLTPVECERLQTVEDNYTSCVTHTAI